VWREQTGSLGCALGLVEQKSDLTNDRRGQTAPEHAEHGLDGDSCLRLADPGATRHEVNQYFHCCHPGLREPVSQLAFMIETASALKGEPRVTFEA